MHDEPTEACRAMICAGAAADTEKRRKAFLCKWHLKCRTVAARPEEAGERLFTFAHIDSSQRKSRRTTNAIGA